MRRRQVATAIVLSLLFIIVYGGCNWITSVRPDVGTLNFAWERHIPLIPLMILPYMSIDLFFVGTPFLCRDCTELRTFAYRVATAILVSGAFFLMIPLRFAFERPVVGGWIGAIFDFLHGFDRPYNLFPSLHVILLAIVAAVYLEHVHDSLRRLLQVLFAFILCSTVLTWQHHVLDIVGGAVAAVVIFYVFRRETTPAAPARNPRAGAIYTVGAASCLVLAFVTWPWGVAALWPSVALAIMAGGYFGLGAAVWRKNAGRVPAAARWLLAPCRLGHWLSLRYYRRRCQRWNEVEPGVLIGSTLGEKEARDAVAAGVHSVLDLTAEFSETGPFRAMDYLNIPVLDLTAPTQQQLERAVEFVDAGRAHGSVYVHCKIGYSRSAAVAGAWLLHAGLAENADGAIVHLRAARPSIVVRPEVRRALEEFADHQSADEEYCACARDGR